MMAATRPDSMFNGVQIGVIAPYSYHNMPNDAKSLLSLIVQDGINATEIQCPAVEEWAGAPTTPPFARMRRPMGAPGSGMNGPPPGQPRPKLTPEQMAVRKSHDEAMTKWRLATPVEKFVEFRKMYNDAGVSIYGFKMDLAARMSDAEFDYAFRVTKALGANQLTMELPDDDQLSARIGQFASKHKMMVGYHAHTL